MYLASVDAEIRAKSNGMRSVDTLLLDLTRRKRLGEKVEIQDWSDLVEKELGTHGRQQYEAMAAGKTEAPPPNSFGPCFHPQPVDLPRYDPGFDPMPLAVVSNLRAASPAAQAGVKVGDLIVSMTTKHSLNNKIGGMMEMKVTRGGQLLTFTFSP